MNQLIKKRVNWASLNFPNLWSWTKLKLVSKLGEVELIENEKENVERSKLVVQDIWSRTIENEEENVDRSKWKKKIIKTDTWRYLKSNDRKREGKKGTSRNWYLKKMENNRVKEKKKSWRNLKESMNGLGLDFRANMSFHLPWIKNVSYLQYV